MVHGHSDSQMGNGNKLTTIYTAGANAISQEQNKTLSQNKIIKKLCHVV
jgi:hypothetical protein